MFSWLMHISPRVLDVGSGLPAALSPNQYMPSWWSPARCAKLVSVPSLA